MPLPRKKLNGDVVKADLLQKVTGHRSSQLAIAKMASRWMLFAQAAARREPKHLADVDLRQQQLSKVLLGYSGNP